MYNVLRTQHISESLKSPTHYETSEAHISESENLVGDLDVASESVAGRAHTASKRTSARKTGQILVTIVVFTVLSLNIAFILGLFLAVHETGADGYPAFFPGSCEKTSQWSTGIHFVINLLSSILLAASNYSMQRLSACTWQEMNTAHRKGSWIEVGTLSLRNFRYISWDRICLWLVLASTSVPIHFLYNSVAIETQAGNLYRVLAVSAPTITSQDEILPISAPTYFYSRFWKEANLRNYENLTAYDCVQRYAGSEIASSQSYLRNGGSVLAVSFDDKLTSDAVFAYGDSTYTQIWRDNASTTLSNFTTTVESRNAMFHVGPTKYEWLSSDMNPTGHHTPLGKAWVCEDLYPNKDIVPTPNYNCDVTSLGTAKKPWTLQGHQISYCLAENLNASCSVQFSTSILIVVTVCNAIKFFVLLYLCIRPHDKSLVILGDAMAECLKNETSNEQSSGMKQETSTGSIWKARKYWWFQSLGWTNGLLSLLLPSAALGIASGLLTVLLDFNQHHTSVGNSGFDSFGTGASQGENGFRYTMSLLGMAFVANSPQVVISLCYIQLNAALTKMTTNAEWTSFTTKRKALRTSDPEGEQRRTYWLQLPYRFSVPLLLISTVLHWAVSQSIFVHRLVLRADGIIVPSASITEIGYSSTALLVSVVLGGVLVLGIAAVGLSQRYPAGLPLLRRTSLVLVETCRRRVEDEGIEMGQMQWGVLAVSEQGHSQCGFTSGQVLYS